MKKLALVSFALLLGTGGGLRMQAQQTSLPLVEDIEEAGTNETAASEGEEAFESLMEEGMEEGGNFFEIQAGFYRSHPEARTQTTTQPTQENDDEVAKFKRWEWFWGQRVSRTGAFPRPDATYVEAMRYKAGHATPRKPTSTGGQWASMGPSNVIGNGIGLGRINAVTFHPTDPDIFWVATGGGGIWQTPNGGASWFPLTDNLPVMGMSDIAVHPTNPDILYIATGDAEANGTYSIGVLMSTDGGQTFAPTGLNWAVMDFLYIRRLIINPVNPNILIAASSNGIYRTTDAGVSWSLVAVGKYKDVEFHPTDPSIIYAASYSAAQIYRSADDGATWTKTSNFTNSQRVNIAVSANNPQLVEVLVAGNDNGMFGLYRSTNAGLTWTLHFKSDCISKNYLANSAKADACGGQGWYDLAFCLNPANANEMLIGGINTWKSSDGGVTFDLKTFWTPAGPGIGAKIVHADKHDLVYHPLLSNTVFECNDGGIAKSTDGGENWTDLSAGLAIGQIYRIGVSQTQVDNVVAGHQDNGTMIWKGTTWGRLTGGDGMDCAIDWKNSKIVYSSYVNGVLYRSWIPTGSTTTISDNIPGQPVGAWLTPYIISPNNDSNVYAGYKNVYKSANFGDAWTMLTTLNTNEDVVSLAEAPSFPGTLYVATNSSLYVSYDDGASWQEQAVIGDLNINGNITCVAISPNDPTIAWITISGYDATSKVLRTDNGGYTWTNITGSLPNLPVSTVVYQKDTDDMVYIGTDMGIFYRDNSMADWEPFFDGMPNVVITDLEIAYNTSQLYAATYGRGVWRSDLRVNVRNDAPLATATVALAPNPAQDRLQVRWIGEQGLPTAWHILDMTGQRLIAGTIAASTTDIGLGEIAAGVYILQVVDGQGNTMGRERFVKE